MKKLLTLLTLWVAVTGTVAAQYSCDSITNLVSPLDTPTYYITNGGAYVSGNNEYGDLIKAEGFYSPVGDTVTSAWLYFAVVTINAADSSDSVKVFVWDNTGTGGAPGNAIDSATVTLGQIAQAVAINSTFQGFVPTQVNFTGHVALSTSGFYVGVVLPATAGDTVALFTNEVPPGPDGNGWEYGVDSAGTAYAWGTMTSDWQFTGGSLGFYISAGVCGYAPIARFTPTNFNGCAADTVNFTDFSGDSVTTWAWNFGDGGTAAVANPQHIFTAAGTYTVVETVSDAKGSDIASTTVTINPIPSASLTVTNANTGTANGTVTLTLNNGNSPVTYLWSNTDTSQNLVNVPGGTYMVTVDANGCYTTDTAVVGIISGINTLSANVKISVYPNPATDILSFVWNLNSQAIIGIYDINGSRVKAYTVNGNAVSNFNITNLATGPYIIRITDAQSGAQRSLLFNKM